MKMKVPQGRPVFFTSDEHYGHYKIIEYNQRPYDNVDSMNQDIINKFNSKVPKNGLTFHLGDFSLKNKKDEVYRKFIDNLNGNHVFIMGSHDKWLSNSRTHEIIELRIDGQNVVLCHYAMKVWPKSHYNSWLLYGHSHGKLESEGKSWDISLDNTGYFPLSWEDVKTIMSKRPDNFNLVRNRRY